MYNPLGMKAIRFIAVVSLFVFIVGITACMNTVKPTANKPKSKPALNATERVTLDLSTETFGIPINQADLFKGDFSKLKPPYRIQTERVQVEGFEGVEGSNFKIYNVTFPGCNIVVEPNIDGTGKDLYLPAFSVIDEKETQSSSSVCPFRTEKGIRLGSTKKEVLSAYGRPTEVMEKRKDEQRTKRSLCYRVNKGSENWELRFVTANDEQVVRSISLHYWKRDTEPNETG
jgi:hypothetical protein